MANSVHKAFVDKEGTRRKAVYYQDLTMSFDRYTVSLHQVIDGRCAPTARPGSV